MGAQNLEEGVRHAWDEAREFFSALQSGTATRPEDPQPRLARELFQLWMVDPQLPAASRALRSAFTMWANAGCAEDIDRALTHLDVHAGYWGGVLRAAGSAYHKSGRSDDYLPLLHRYDGLLTHPESASALYAMLGEAYLRAGRLEEATTYYRQAVALATDPAAVVQVEGALHELEHLQPNQLAPEISGQTIDGQPVRLTDFSGRIVCLDFWATDCGFCWPEMPFLREIRAAYADTELVIIGISRDQDQERMRKVVEQETLSWLQIWEPVVHAEGAYRLGPIATAYNAWGIPRTVLIDGAGKIVAKDLRGAALVAAVREAIS